MFNRGLIDSSGAHTTRYGFAVSVPGFVRPGFEKEKGRPN